MAHPLIAMWKTADRLQEMENDVFQSCLNMDKDLRDIVVKLSMEIHGMSVRLERVLTDYAQVMREEIRRKNERYLRTCRTCEVEYDMSLHIADTEHLDWSKYCSFACQEQALGIEPVK